MNHAQGSDGRLQRGGPATGVGTAKLEYGQRLECRYLYVWAGHVDHEIADFLAVIDFDEDSPGYGRVINIVPLPGPGATFNEPHHMHLTVDGSILGCGGLLSVLSGQPVASSESFLRLRSAGVLSGESIREMRPRCRLYANYLKMHLL